MLKIFSTPVPCLYDVAICCIVKDESYLPEWIDYHLSVGVSQFFIYDNQSAIPVSQILQFYIDDKLVVVENLPGKVKQMEAYGNCLKKYGAQCKWIAFIDADEFIVPKTAPGNLPAFLLPYEGFGGLGINWLIFGSNGHVEKPAGLQLESYTHRIPKTHFLNTHIKSIVQPKYVRAIPSGPHHFHYKLGRYSVDENFKRFKGAYSNHSTDKIQLNHYWLRSESDFKEKLQRGRADQNVPEMARRMEDFYQTNKEATEPDTTILDLKKVIALQSSKK